MKRQMHQNFILLYAFTRQEHEHVMFHVMSLGQRDYEVTRVPDPELRLLLD